MKSETNTMHKLTKEHIISEIKNREKEIKERFDVKHLSLFGSFAQGNHTENSDIDILLSSMVNMIS
jgi:predicted nucleotidyltransferase